MDWDRFFRLAPSEAASAAIVEVIDESLDEAALALGDLRLPSLRLEWIAGKRLADLLGSTGGHLLLISDRVKRALQEGEFTGWSSVPAVIVDRSGREVARYDVLVIEGRSGAIRDDLSQRVTLPPRAPGGEPGPGLRGLLFDPDTWDGSDIFAPEGTTLSLVSSRVKQALDQLRPTNTLLEPITEIERIVY